MKMPIGRDKPHLMKYNGAWFCRKYCPDQLRWMGQCAGTASFAFEKFQQQPILNVAGIEDMRKYQKSP